VLAVEPSAAMRAHCGHRPVVGGDAAALPLRAGTVDAVWLSTVIHHVPDLAALARELRRVLRPGGRVLIRSAFAGRPEGISLFRFFPEAAATQAAADGLRRAAHTPLQLISDEAYAAGVARLQAAARTETGPLIDTLDLVVLS
jgi:SAM-dependent methyltransferase